MDNAASAGCPGLELFENAQGLMAEQEWIAVIDDLKAKQQSCAPRDLDTSLISAVAVRSVKPLALLFSGGVDSALLALLLKRIRVPFTAYAVGMEGSPDMRAAAGAANVLGIPLVSQLLSIDDVGAVMDALPPILGPAVHPTQNLNVLFGVAAVEYAAISMAVQQGYGVVMGGLGSEEIFAGYQRHASASDINRECWRGLQAMWGRDLVRDALIAKAFGVKVVTPYLDQQLIQCAMGIPGALKIVEGVKKACLREAAIRLGLPEQLAGRPKKAAQYGSGFDRAIRTLAVRQGCRNRHEFLLQKMKGVPGGGFSKGPLDKAPFNTLAG